MSMNRWMRSLAAAGSALAMLLTSAAAGFGQCQGWASLGGQSQCCETGCTSCNCWDCPPPIKYCAEGGPWICVVCGCPKPVCCPSNAAQLGLLPDLLAAVPVGAQL